MKLDDLNIEQMREYLSKLIRQIKHLKEENRRLNNIIVKLNKGG